MTHKFMTTGYKLLQSRSGTTREARVDNLLAFVETKRPRITSAVHTINICLYMHNTVHNFRLGMQASLGRQASLDMILMNELK